MSKKSNKKEESEEESEDQLNDFQTKDAYNFEVSEKEKADSVLDDSDLDYYPEEFNKDMDDAAQEAAEKEKKKKKIENTTIKQKETKTSVKSKIKTLPKEKKTKSSINKKSIVKQEKIKEEKKKIKKTKKKITKKAVVNKVETKSEVKNEPKEVKTEVEEPEDSSFIEKDEKRFNLFSGRNVVIAICLILVVVWIYAVFLPASGQEMQITDKLNISEDKLIVSEQNIPEKDNSKTIPEEEKKDNVANTHVKIIKRNLDSL